MSTSESNRVLSVLTLRLIKVIGTYTPHRRTIPLYNRCENRAIPFFSECVVVINLVVVVFGCVHLSLEVLANSR